jgi:site-specific DNA recombinase
VLAATITAMVDAQRDPSQTQALAAVRQTVDACDARLKRYRAALEAGTDPGLVQLWISEVQAERTVAETTLRQLTNPSAMTHEQIAW